jgi:transcriptional regulator with XRE-family HTH domain
MHIRLKDRSSFEKMLMINGHSKRSFAKEAGVSNPFLIQVVSGKRYASPRSAKKIADALNVPFEEIFFIEDACKSEQTPKSNTA